MPVRPTAPPLGCLLRRPCGRLLVVAAGAGVWRAERDGQVGTRDAETVVAARVDLHVGARRHVAAHATGAGGARLVEVVRRRVVTLWRQPRESLQRRIPVALETDAIALRAQRQPMGIMAIRTPHSRLVHPALDERSPDVDLVLNLPVRVVEPLGQPGGQKVIEKRARVAIELADAMPPGMATGARPQLHPGPIGREVDEQAVRRCPGRPRRSRRWRRLRHRCFSGPVHVRRAGPVTRLAADIDLGPDGTVAIALDVVVLA